MARSGLCDRRAGRVAGIVQIFLDRAQQAVGKAGAPVLAGRLARRVGCSDLLEAARQRIELRRHVARFCLDGGTLILAILRQLLLIGGLQLGLGAGNGGQLLPLLLLQPLLVGLGTRLILSPGPRCRLAPAGR